MKNTRNSAQLFYMPPEAEALPLADRADGIYIWDTDDNRYIDASSGPVAVNLGHGNTRVIEAMHQQAQDVCLAFPLVFGSNPNIEVTERLVELTGLGLDRALFVSGGSEAVEACVKFARIYALRRGEASRHLMISRNPSYHGATLGAQALTGDEVMTELYGEIMKPSLKVPTPLGYRPPDGMTAEEHADYCADALEQTIVDAGPENVLGFIIEPVAGLSLGAAIAPDNYYRRIREICTRYGVLLIFDEVMSGSGRTGKFLAAHNWPDYAPDLVALSKGLGAGYMPLGALVGRSEMVDFVARTGGFPHGQTYTSTPLASATSNAVLQELIDGGLMENTRTTGAYLRQRLDKLVETCPIAGDARGQGLLQAVEFVRNKATKEMFPTDVNVPQTLGRLGRGHGLSLYPRRANGGRFGEFVMITPPLIITPEQCDDMVERLERTIADFLDLQTRAGLKIA